MALGGASLVLLMVWLWNSWPPDGGRAQDPGDSKVSAPPELVAKVPLAAKALVAAGYTSTAEEESAEVEATAAHGMASEVVVVTSGPATSSGQEAVVIVGDTRYSWQDWSPWHCNCPAGSMSRVRNITYSVPGVRLDPIQYDVLRFEREVCSYTACRCNRTARECDQPAVSCTQGPPHLCALEDIQQDHARQRQQFWAHVHEGLKKLWQTVRGAFQSQPEITKDKNK